jgi:hypothetical protein
MRMCFETELSEMSNGAAISVTRACPPERRCRMLRRLSDESALKLRWLSKGKHHALGFGEKSQV